MFRICIAALGLLVAAVMTSAAEPAAGPAAAAPSTTPVLKTEYAFTVRATVGAPVVVGNGPEGLRRFIPIEGGTFTGPLLSGKVVAGSGDWQVVRADGVLAVEARYTLETSDGVLIAVTNSGFRHAPPDIMAKLTRGEPVPPNSYYFRTAAHFEAPIGSAHDWVNRTLFVATAEREPNKAIIHFFRVL
ncbi:MAG: DUF3237 domain-containing protein [Gammaproteobacteria bacterium]